MIESLDKPVIKRWFLQYKDHPRPWIMRVRPKEGVKFLNFPTHKAALEFLTEVKYEYVPSCGYPNRATQNHSSMVEGPSGT